VKFLINFIATWLIMLTPLLTFCWLFTGEPLWLDIALSIAYMWVAPQLATRIAMYLEK
jgi:hypothetical protein